MRLFQSYLATIGILCAGISLGYGKDDENTNNNDVYIESVTPPPTKIAFLSEREENREIFVMNSDGTVQINITNNQGDDFLPDWSSGH